MDIGLSHVITVNGEIYNAYWDLFNPNQAIGNVHSIMIFEEDIPLDSLFQRLDEAIATETIQGSFYLKDKTQSMYKFDANYSVFIEALDEDIDVKQFVFVSDGVPWTLCKLDKPVTVRANTEAVFTFTSTVLVNNNDNIATNLWNINVDKFNIKYAAMVHPVEEFSRNVLASSSKALMDDPSDNVIAVALKNGVELKPDYILEPGKIGIHIKAKTRNDVVGVKAIFIRILWNLGIMIYIDSVTYGGVKIDSLTLARGHELTLVFGLNFKEVT